MPVPPLPAPLDQIGARPFSFYPPIIGIEHNEWSFRSATWSEFLVFNAAANKEIWIPRRLIGEVSRVDEPVVIVGLNKELEYKGGMLVPHERRVIEMPPAINQTAAATAGQPAEVQAPASVVSIALEGTTESRAARLILIVIAVGILACLAVVLVLRDGKRVAFQTVEQADLSFTSNDDYWSVVNRLGKPDEDRWRSSQGELQYHLLGYPAKNLYIVLMGPDRKDMHYVGSYDKDWRVVHSSNPDTNRILHTLKRF